MKYYVSLLLIGLLNGCRIISIPEQHSIVCFQDDKSGKPQEVFYNGTASKHVYLFSMKSGAYLYFKDLNNKEIAISLSNKDCRID